MLTIQDLKASPEHLTTLAEWHQGEWSGFNPGESLEQRIARMRTYLNANFIPSTFIAVDDRLLGSAAIVANDMTNRPDLSPWLASVYVAKDYRGDGIGSRLVKYVMQQAKSQNIDTLYLFTPDQTQFYQRLGWVIFEDESYQGQDVTIMMADLTK